MAGALNSKAPATPFCTARTCRQQDQTSDPPTRPNLRSAASVNESSSSHVGIKSTPRHITSGANVISLLLCVLSSQLLALPCKRSLKSCIQKVERICFLSIDRTWRCFASFSMSIVTAAFFNSSAQSELLMIRFSCSVTNSCENFGSAGVEVLGSWVEVLES